MTCRRAYIVEDSGAGKAPMNPVACFKLVPEGESKAILEHLGVHPTLSMEAFRGIPLAPYWSLTPLDTSRGQSREGSPVGIYTLLDGAGPVCKGERIVVVGGNFGLAMLATRAEVRARWAGKIRSRGVVGNLPDAGQPLQTIVEIE
jgi:hypothetical protein